MIHYFEHHKIDVILYPTCSIIPPKISDIHGPEWTIEHNGQKMAEFLISTKNVDVASAGNFPAISLPTQATYESGELPINIELATLTGYDRKLLTIAKSVEKALLK